MQHCEEQLVLLITKEECISLSEQMTEVSIVERNILIRKNLWESVSTGVLSISEWMKTSFSKVWYSMIHFSLLLTMCGYTSSVAEM